MKDNDSPVKKKFWIRQLVKKVVLGVFWEMQRPITVDFLEKSSIIKSAS